MDETILEVLMYRDNMSLVEANDLIDEAKIMLNEYLQEGDTSSASEICREYFGLEEDYIFELL